MEYELANDKFKIFQIEEIKLSNGINYNQESIPDQNLIEENFDYTLRLFERKDQDRINMIKEEAFDNRKVKADAPQEIQRESTTRYNPYVDELQRFK